MSFTHDAHFSLFFLLIPALLSQTLRTYTRTGCEHEPITLSCPRGTSISIDVAQYMPTTIENECVTVTSNIIQDGVVNAGTEIEIKAPEKCSSWQTELSVSTFTNFFPLPPLLSNKTSIIDYTRVCFSLKRTANIESK